MENKKNIALCLIDDSASLSDQDLISFLDLVKNISKLHSTPWSNEKLEILVGFISNSDKLFSIEDLEDSKKIIHRSFGGGNITDFMNDTLKTAKGLKILEKVGALFIFSDLMDASPSLKKLNLDEEVQVVFIANNDQNEHPIKWFKSHLDSEVPVLKCQEFEKHIFDHLFPKTSYSSSIKPKL